VVAAHRLADDLSSLLSERVRLTVHDNRSTMVSFRREPGEIHFRVHHMFLSAPGEVITALASFAGPPRGGASARRRKAGLEIDAYVRQHRGRIAAPRPAYLQPRGRAHDLQAIFDRVNAEHFAGRVEARIGWGPVVRRVAEEDPRSHAAPCRIAPALIWQRKLRAYTHDRRRA
jgi:hypothetical protein